MTGTACPNLTVVTVDDEPLALRRLELAIAQLPGFVLAGEADGCNSGATLVAARRPDILIVDIKMRDGSGFDLIERIAGEPMPAIIFATAFDTFAVKAFETRAVDYVLKPIELPRLREALHRARARIADDAAVANVAEMKAVIENLRDALHARDGAPDERQIWIRGANGTMSRVALSDVVLVSSEDDYIRLHLANGSHLVRMSILGFMEQVPRDSFVRVHRAALVRRAAIANVTRQSGGMRVTLHDGRSVEAGRVHARALTAMIRGGRLD